GGSGLGLGGVAGALGFFGHGRLFGGFWLAVRAGVVRGAGVRVSISASFFSRSIFFRPSGGRFLLSGGLFRGRLLGRSFLFGGSGRLGLSLSLGLGGSALLLLGGSLLERGLFNDRGLLGGRFLLLGGGRLFGRGRGRLFLDSGLDSGLF